MMANHHLARAIGDVGFYEFRRQLEYKMALRGGLLVVAPRFCPSSKALPLLRWEERGFDAQRPFVGMPALRGDRSKTAT